MVARTDVRMLLATLISLLLPVQPTAPAAASPAGSAAASSSLAPAAPPAAAAPAAERPARDAVLRGEVRDTAGAPVTGADIVLRDADDRVVARTITDASGRYVLVGLTPGGPYTLTAERLGYGTVRRENLHLAADESRRIDITLSSRPVDLPGIDVISAADMVFSGTRTGASTVIEERAVRATPTIDRDVTALSALSPMVAIQEEAISVAGQNSRFNSLRVDGALAQDVFGLSPSGVPGGQANAKPLPIDAIRQYSVLVAPFDVRQSGFTGGLLNATTRSGSDRWEATAFAYYRDAAFSGVADDTDLNSARGYGVHEDFRTETGGFTIGGPIGAARVFAAGELERRRRPLPGFHLGRTQTFRIGLVADSVDRMLDLFREGYGIEPGEPGSYTLENPLGNLFVRLDAPVGARHRLTARYNHISAEEDVPVGRLGFGPYDLTSKGTRIESRTHSVSTRLGTRLGERTTNEVLFNVQRTADATRAVSDLPQIEVRIDSRVENNNIFRHVQLGGDALAHDNELDQTVVQLANNLSHAVGDHLFTVGVDGTWFGASRRFLPASRGIWRFNSLEDLERNAPNAYERLILLDGQDPTVDVSVLQLATYVQDEWSVGRDLSLTLGLRLDLPITMARPGYNRHAELTTGVVTDRLPSGNPMVSPRLGFNWSPEGRRRTQVRGGIGIFTGLPPLAWIADAYANTGLRTAFLACMDRFNQNDERVRVAPGYTDGPAPTTCLDGAGPSERNITFFADDFRYPQDIRGSVGVDRELPGGFVASLEALYTRAIHQVALQDLNLGLPVVNPAPNQGYPEHIGARPIYGSPLLVPERFGPLAPGRRWDDYGRVIEVGNRSRNAALVLAAELQRRFSDRLDMRLAYTFNRGVDTRSLLYQDAALNYGLTPIRDDPTRPETQLTAFDRPHRVLGSVWSRLAEWGDGFEATLMYVGQSGLPYSYVYETDMNGDGYPGPGAVEEAYNDLFYVPRGYSDISAGITSSTLVLQLATLEPCLAESAGRTLARNTCRAPWSNRLDLRLSQGISTGRGTIRITGDIMNVLNLVNPEWGLVHVAPPVIPIFRVDQRLGCPALDCNFGYPLNGWYVGPRRRDTATGHMVAELPYIVSLPDSQWRAQLGVRLEF